jgi:hypothetical protein
MHPLFYRVCRLGLGGGGVLCLAACETGDATGEPGGGGSERPRPSVQYASALLTSLTPAQRTAVCDDLTSSLADVLSEARLAQGFCEGQALQAQRDVASCEQARDECLRVLGEPVPGSEAPAEDDSAMVPPSVPACSQPPARACSATVGQVADCYGALHTALEEAYASCDIAGDAAARARALSAPPAMQPAACQALLQRCPVDAAE